MSSPAPDRAPAALANDETLDLRPGAATDAQAAPAGRILAIGGGKGGIGKSLLSASLGIELARRGLRVTLVDLDLGGANLHTCLGMEMPEVSLSSFVFREVESLEEVRVETGIENLSLVSGSHDALAVSNPLYQQKLRLMRAVQALDTDIALLDLGAGTTYNVLDFFLLADRGVVTLVPDPTSVENAYRFIKAAFFRRLRAVETVYGIAPLLDETVKASKPRSPADFLRQIEERKGNEASQRVVEELRRFRPALVVNSVREAGDLALGENITTAWRRFFGIELDYLGYVRHDPEAWRAARLRRPLLLERVGQPIAEDFSEIADRILEDDAEVQA